MLPAPRNCNPLNTVKPKLLGNMAVYVADNISKAVVAIYPNLSQVAPDLGCSNASFSARLAGGYLCFIMQRKLSQVTQVFLVNEQAFHAEERFCSSCFPPSRGRLSRHFNFGEVMFLQNCVDFIDCVKLEQFGACRTDLVDRRNSRWTGNATAFAGHTFDEILGKPPILEQQQCFLHSSAPLHFTQATESSTSSSWKIRQLRRTRRRSDRIYGHKYCRCSGCRRPQNSGSDFLSSRPAPQR